MPDGPFLDVVADKLAFLMSEHGFQVTEVSEHVILLDNIALSVEGVWDPRGEVDVNVFRRGQRAAGMWSYIGMVGKASVGRLLELAGDAIRAEPCVLQADTTFYDNLAVEQKKRSIEWTAYYSRKGPRPRGKLP